MSFESFFVPYASAPLLGSGAIAVIAPHPDDEVFGCGGALVQAVAEGRQIDVLIVSDGAAQGAADAGDVAQVRAAESVAAAACIGYPEPEFWGVPDGCLAAEQASLNLRIQAWLSRKAYALVLFPSIWEMHPDHRAVAQAVLAAEQHLPPQVGLMMYEVGVPLRPNRLVDVTLGYSRKLEAMGCFRSQLRMQAYDVQIQGLNRYRAYTLGPGVQYAEAFCMLDRGEADLQALLAGMGQETLIAQNAQAQTDELRQCSDQMRAELERAKQALAAMRLSTSWRVTAPLRWLKQKLGGNEAD